MLLGVQGVQAPGVQAPGVQAPGVQAPGVHAPGVQSSSTRILSAATHRYASALRALARERGVFVTFVDLRWGVTVAQATGGEVVDICLSQLQQSKYFVNFLGLRYGWRPGRDDLTKGTFDKYGHMINSYIPGRSVTELEVISGALGWAADATCAPSNAFFYVRADSYCDDLPEDLVEAFTETDVKVQRKLIDLKKRIRARAVESSKYHGKTVSGSKLPFVECCRDYEEPADFARMLYEDLLVAIKRDFPEKKIRSALDEQFVRSPPEAHTRRAHACYLACFQRTQHWSAHQHWPVHRACCRCATSATPRSYAACTSAMTTCSGRLTTTSPRGPPPPHRASH